jgi:hypothetical protein
MLFLTSFAAIESVSVRPRPLCRPGRMRNTMNEGRPLSAHSAAEIQAAR